MNTVRLHSTEIACEGCVNSIKRALGAMQGVSSVVGDASTQTVEVAYDPTKVSAEALIARMEKAGFPATVAG